MEPIPSTSIYSWNVNGLEVRLLETHDSLSYETVNTKDSQTIYGEPFDLTGRTIEKMISYLKKCRVMIGQEGKASFLRNCKTWSVGNKEISLLGDSLSGKSIDQLAWDVFCNSTKETTFFPFQKSTIASARCHSATVAIIEKIKNESFTNLELRQLLNDFKVVRVLDGKTYKKEYEELIEKKRRIEEAELRRYIQENEEKPVTVAATYLTLGLTLATSYAEIASAAVAASSFFGGAALGSVAAFYAGTILALTPAAVIPAGAAFLYSNWRYHTDAENRKAIENKKKFEYHPTFIEIEPKLTAPSVMDDRILVSKFTWAVTIITGPDGYSAAHTAIIVEGLANAYFKELDDGQYFMHRSHFKAPVKSGICSEDKFKEKVIQGVQKTETWMISSKKVESMLRLIKEEKSLQQEKIESGEEVKLDRPGNKSKFGEGHHSCFTWARQMVKTLGVKVIKARLGLPQRIFSYPLDYTHTFEEHRQRPFIVRI